MYIYGRQDDVPPPSLPPPSKDVHSLTSRACDYITLCNKRDLADRVKAKDQEMGELSKLSKNLIFLLKSQQWKVEFTSQRGIGD